MQSPDWIQTTCPSPTDTGASKTIPIRHPTKYRPSPSLEENLRQSNNWKNCCTDSVLVWLLMNTLQVVG